MRRYALFLASVFLIGSNLFGSVTYTVTGHGGPGFSFVTPGFLGTGELADLVPSQMQSPACGGDIYCVSASLNNFGADGIEFLLLNYSRATGYISANQDFFPDLNFNQAGTSIGTIFGNILTITQGNDAVTYWSPAPEPSTFELIALSGLAFFALRRRLKLRKLNL